MQASPCCRTGKLDSAMGDHKTHMAPQVHVCTHCGLMGYYDANLGYAVCPSRKVPDDMARLKLPYACKLLFQELQSMNIVPRLRLAEA